MLSIMKKIWDWFVALFTGKKKGVAVKLIINRVLLDGTVIERDIKMAIITNTQQLPLAVQALDAKNQPAQIDGIPVWACSDITKATIVPHEDGLSCVVKGLANGTVTITVSGKNLKGDTIVSDPLTVEVVSGMAVKLVIVAGTPVEQA